MACEVLCSDVGHGSDTLLNALVDGYVDDDDNDDDDVKGEDDAGEEKKDGAAASSSVEDDDDDDYTRRRDRRRPPRRRRVLDLLFGVLMDTPPSSLDDRRAGYLEKVLNLLFRRRGQSMCDYMNTSSIVIGGGGWGSDGTTTTTRRRCVDKVAASCDDGAWDLGSPLSAETEYDGGGSHDFRGGSYTDLPGSRSYEADDRSEPDGTINDDDDDDDPTMLKTAPPASRPCEFPNGVPPVLMCALFDHLHSHSIMHIVQRLLLPSPTRRQATSGRKRKDVGACAHGDGDDDDDEEDTNGDIRKRIGEINERFISALSAMNNDNGGTKNEGMGNVFGHEDEIEDDEDDEDPANHIFQCDWSTLKTDQVLELLLRRLEGDTSSFLVGYGHPVGYNAPCRTHANGKKRINGTIVAEANERHREIYEESRLSAQEATLSCSQHASEILITIIQNSPLDSPFMRSLSSDPMLQRIIDLIIPVSLSSSLSCEMKEPEFVAHDSIMTCAINVLESLVLQLGGYGAVAATSTGDSVFVNGTQGAKIDAGGRKTSSCTDDAGTRMTDYDLALNNLPSPSAAHPPTLEIASASALLRHVTALLTRLSELLTHPIARTWIAPVQYSNGRPRMLLGASRLRILRLVESLVLLGNPSVDAALQSSDCLEKCLDLFWQFEWCSMLHQSVANMLVHVFEGGVSRSGLQEYFLRRCNLVGRLMDSFIDGEEDHIIIIPSSSGGGSTGSIVGNDVEGPSEEEEELEQFIKDDIAFGLPRYTQYGELTIGLPVLSSTELAHHGSQSDYGAIGEDEVDAVAPVSEDDVDSAMEQEFQAGIGEALIAMTSEDGGEDVKAIASPDLVTDNSSSSTPQGGFPNQTCFRKGYMGHVIIICQALVHACSNSASHGAEQMEDGNGVIERVGEPPLKSPAALDEISITTSFETSAIHAKSRTDDDEFSCSNSKKRKDRSPVRGGEEDIKRLASSPSSNISGDLSGSPTLLVSNESSSPAQVESSDVYQSPIENKSDQPRRSPMSIDNILRQHPLFEKWQNFVASVLASEMSIQSTPLGGQLAATNPNASRVVDGSSDLSPVMPTVVHDNFGGDFLGIDDDGPSPFLGSGLFGGLVVGEIDMDENDLDIAASMMEALRVGNNRHRPCLGGETVGSEKGSRGIANFGSVIQQPGGFQDYVYDDPLGQVHPFENGDSNDEDLNGVSNKNSDDDGFMSDAMVVPRDGGVAKQHSNGNKNIKKTGSSSSDEVDDDEDDEDEDDVPVMDLFAGSFDPNFANFEAMSSDCDPFASVEATNGSIDDMGHAKIDDQFQFSKTPLDLVDSLSSDFEDKDPD